MLIREANLPTGAVKRPLLFKAIHKGSDIYDVDVLDFWTCRKNIIDQYTVPGCKCSSPKIDELKAPKLGLNLLLRVGTLNHCCPH